MAESGIELSEMEHHDRETEALTKERKFDAPEKLNDQKIAKIEERKDFEDSLRKVLKQEKFILISEKITPKALTKCEKNSLFMSMEVSYELRRLANRKLPNVDDVTKLASSVEDFTNSLIDPLKSDLELRSDFQKYFDHVMETAIELQQKKFFTHPVIDNLKNDRWYGDIGKIWTPSYFTVSRWIWIFLDIWCLFDLVLFPILFTVLYLVHIARGKTQNHAGPRQKDLYENYQDYFTTPYFIFIRDNLSYLVLLGLHFAICLSPTSIEMTGIEWAIMLFFMGRILMEILQLCDTDLHLGMRKQHELKIGERLKERWKIYIRSSWNRLDLVTLLVYTCTFFLRMATWSSSATVVQNRSLVINGYLYGLNTMILTFRVFGQVMETVKGLGTIQIALFSIISDVATIFWLFAATILAFSLAITKVYMSEKSYLTRTFDATRSTACRISGPSCWWAMVKHLCWSLLGIAEVDSLDSVDEPTIVLAQMLYAAYLVVAGILLINMMIALLSNTYQRVEDNSLKEWSFKKAITIQTYTSLNPIPVPLNLVSSLVMGVFWLCKKCIGKFRNRNECRGGRKTEDVSRATLDDIIKDLQNTYFATYGYSFPLTEEGKLEKVLDETEGNRQIVNQIAHHAFMNRQDVLPTGSKAWQSIGLKVKDCLLMYEGTKHCESCSGCPQSSTARLHHGARYVVPFSKKFPQFEVLILGTGSSRYLDVGVVWKEHDPHSRPGHRAGSVGYHANGNIFVGEGAEFTVGSAIDVPVANRGDLIGCSIKFETEQNGKVPVVFSLNGKRMTEEEIWIEYNQTDKQLYPYVGMGEDGVQVLAKMSPAGNVDVPKQTELVSEDVVVGETAGKQPCPETSDGKMEAIHRELDDTLATFRRLRNNILVNFRNFEDLFDDRHRELSKLANKAGEYEGEVIVRKLDEQELACCNIVKRIKQDLDELGEMTNKKSRVVLKTFKQTEKQTREKIP